MFFGTVDLQKVGNFGVVATSLELLLAINGKNMICCKYTGSINWKFDDNIEGGECDERKF